MRQKYLVMAIVRCDGCYILFRVPTDPVGSSEEFYHGTYESGFTMDCPTLEDIKNLKTAHFRGMPKDFSGRLRLLEAHRLAKESRLFDFGASWGYGTWQLEQAG